MGDTQDTEVKGAVSFNLCKTTGQLRRGKVTADKSSLFDQEAVKKNEEKDFVSSAGIEGLKSVKEKPVVKELVIPLIKRNNWRQQDGKDFSIDKQAAEEILEELKRGEDKEQKDLTMTIPLLMQNRIPGTEKLSSEDDVYAKDVTLRPSESTLDDYEQVPVSAFGSAMLRGMGWQKGQPIGLTNKGLTEPVEYIPRFKGLGLGAEKRPEEEKTKRKRKPGDPTESNLKKFAPIVEKDGRVRHVKGINEVIKDQPKGYHAGALGRIEKGSHQDLYGKIVAVDEDNARVTVKLALSDELITISQYHVTLVDEEEYKSKAKLPRNSVRRPTNVDDEKKKSKRNGDQVEGKTTSQKGHRKAESNQDERRSWLAAGIRVRIISQKFKKGRYYNKKVEILDVISGNKCTCLTDDKKMLDGLRVSELETVVPKHDNALVLFVHGKYQGQIGKVIERHASKCRATVQLLTNKHVTKTDYDDISEYVGDVPDELFLD